MTYKSVNPDTPTDIVAEVRYSDRDDVDRAVVAAGAALGSWSRMVAAERGRLLGEVGDSLGRSQDEFATLIAREVGKPIVEARAEVARAVAIHHYYSQLALLADGESYPASVPDAWLLVRRYPIGVCAMLTPWNFPIAIPVWKAVPALIYGNTVVLKPAPAASEVARRYHAVAAAILPADVVSIVYGDAEVGGALVTNSGVDAISFTGSVEVGRSVAKRAAINGARFQGEFSGHNPSVVLADADVPSAARTIAWAAMSYAGQKCTATGRIIVESSIYDAFRDQLLGSVSGLTLKNPMSESCDVGPMIGDQARATAVAAVEGLRGDVLIGGQPVPASHGYYLEPTVVELDPAFASSKEIFAPVVLLTRAENAEKAIDQANAGEYGLVASVFTSSIGRAIRFADQLKVGLVRVNAPTAGVDYHVPFGGAKASGMGPKEQGLAAREFYTDSRSILVRSAGPPSDMQ